MNGWIKLHRRLLDWEWSGDPNMMALFIHLLLKASNRNTAWKGIELQRGQVVTGLHSLSEQTGISVQRLRTCLTRLERSGEIFKKSTNKNSLITICNFNKYQDKESGQQQTSNKQATNKQQHREKVKKVKKTTLPEHDPNFMAFWEKYPRKLAKPKAYKAWVKNNCGNGAYKAVMSGLEKYISGPWQGKDKKYIPYPSTWLNDGRWNDEIENIEVDDGWI